MIQISDRDFKRLKKEVDKASDGLEEYAETLEDTWTCREHLEHIYEILEKYEVKKISKSRKNTIDAPCE